MPFGKRKKRPEISSPTNFEHRVHSGYDHNQGVFVGLPTQWNSIINETEQQKLLEKKILNHVNNTTCTSPLSSAAAAVAAMYNNGQRSYRPKPIIDPSRITPTELSVFKVDIFF
jgi:hypothetical protein